MAALSLSFCSCKILFRYKSGNGLTLAPKAFPSLIRKHGRELSVSPIINNALTSTKKGVSRRSGNHHNNVWDDEFIQSLPKAKQAPLEVERVSMLIREIKNMFNNMAVTENDSAVDDLIERLSLIDNVERLGIDRHFQNEIKVALDYVFRFWNKKGIGRGRGSPTDLNTTALGLRILRLHRYDVSSDVLEYFKGKDGQFLSSTCGSEQALKSCINLYRASLIAFPWEGVMDDAKNFGATYLKEALPKIESSCLSREIEFNLEYGWSKTVARLEARNYIDIYGGDSLWTEKTMDKARDMSNKKLLDLAKLDFNMIQSLQLEEIRILSRWWKESGLPQLKFARHRHVEYYCLAGAIRAEPKYSAFRIGFAKLSAIVTIIDDIYDTYGTLEELQLFTNAVKRWDPSATECLPEYMKIAYMALYDVVNEQAREAEKTQGRNTLHYAREAWEACMAAYMQEAKWIDDGYIPTLEEYLEIGKVSVGSRLGVLQPVLTLDALLPENLLPKIDHPSRFNELIGLTLRLKGDTINFKAEAERGETASSISCYMRDHPGSTEEEALNYINALLEKLLRELNWECLKVDNVPTISKDSGYAILRALHLLYKEGDGISVATRDTKDYVTKLLIEPVIM